MLKPFGPARLSAAMERIRSAIGEPAGVGAIERLSRTLAGKPISRLFVRTGGSLVPRPVADVCWFQADGDYVIAHPEGARHVLHLSLSRLGEGLDAQGFVQVHRAHLRDSRSCPRVQAGSSRKPRGRANEWTPRSGKPREGARTQAFRSLIVVP